MHVVTSIALSLSLLSAASTMIPRPGRASAAPIPEESRLLPLQVPTGDGTPVVTDGIFTPGEWDDAKSIDLNGAVRFYYKQFRGVVFLGIKAKERNGIGPSELSVAEPSGPICVLHVSNQLAERILPLEGEAPPLGHFGLTPDWYANELRRDMEEAERLQKEGKSPIEVMTASAYPSDGIEFAVRRVKFPGNRWLIRLAISFLDNGKPGWLIYPADCQERSTEGWLELLLP